MPSVTDHQQKQTSTSSGKTTPPPQTQQAAGTDVTNADPLTQAIMVLEKKQRNLMKRKEKLESYQKEAKDGKELNKDQKEALGKYPEVLSHIDCVKELHDQFKKIHTESSKNQKRLSKQAAEEKRLLVSERLREYARIRYLLENRPTSLSPEESALLDELSPIIIPLDNSLNSVSRSVDVFLSIYQPGPSSTMKSLKRKSPQELRDLIEEMIKRTDTEQATSISANASAPALVENDQINESNEKHDVQPASRTINEYPLQFDTRNQNIPLEQIIQDNTFFPIDLNDQQLQEDSQEQAADRNQYIQTFTVVNSNINEQPPSSIEHQQQDSSNIVHSGDDQHHSDEQWQHQKGNSAAQRMGQHPNGSANKHYSRGGANNFGQQQWRGSRAGGGGRYDNSHGNSQRPYNENNRGRGGSNQNYRGNRGGNYRGGNRGYNNNGNGFQKSAQYQQHNDQRQQARSAPLPQQQ